MDPAVFEEWMMTGLVSILIIFMGFIVWDLAKASSTAQMGQRQFGAIQHLVQHKTRTHTGHPLNPCQVPQQQFLIMVHVRHDDLEPVSYTHLTLPTIYSV